MRHEDKWAWQGVVLSIYTTGEAAAPMELKPEVRAVVGKGLEGDRYFKGVGKYSHITGPLREVTFIESEALEAVSRDKGIKLDPSQTRRNILTSGAPLNHLVGRKFRVGEVELYGVRLCEPCAYLEKLTYPGVFAALVHRGGVRGQIINDGVIRVGDVISPIP